jgi:hypothetical protein
MVRSALSAIAASIVLCAAPGAIVTPEVMRDGFRTSRVLPAVSPKSCSARRALAGQVGLRRDAGEAPLRAWLGTRATCAWKRHGVAFPAEDARGHPRGGETTSAPPITWTIDNLNSIGGHPVTVAGSPRLVDTPAGPAVEFNGATDGLFLDVNPLQGLKRFTLEVMLAPAAGGPEEQRFLHIQQSDADNRALLELRMAPDKTWCLDAFLRFGPPGLTLIDRALRHPSESWHTVVLVYDGRTMAQFVDGKKELEGVVEFGPMGSGRTSIGVRQNRVSWFKGRIRLVRVWDGVSPEWSGE